MNDSAKNMGPGPCVKGGPEPTLLDPNLPPFLKATLRERGKKYGDYKMMSECAQRLKLIVRSYAPKDMEPHMRESLDMICLKMARILCGDPEHFDSWHDIEGYAKLVSDRLTPKAEV